MYNFNQRVKQLESFAMHTGLYDPEPGSIVDCTYGSLFAGQNDEHKSPVDWSGTKENYRSEM